MAAERMSGTVKWFSRVKGYGFIAPDGEESEVFVHFTGIEGEGYRNLEKGEKVSFVIEDTEKGPQAVQVRAEGFDVTSWTAEPTDDPAEGVVGETSWRAEEVSGVEEQSSDVPADEAEETSGSEEETSDELVEDMDEAAGSEEETSDELVEDMDEASGSEDETSDESAEAENDSSESDEASGENPPDLVA